MSVLDQYETLVKEEIEQLKRILALKKEADELSMEISTMLAWPLLHAEMLERLKCRAPTQEADDKS